MIQKSFLIHKCHVFTGKRTVLAKRECREVQEHADVKSAQNKENSIVQLRQTWDARKTKTLVLISSE